MKKIIISALFIITSIAAISQVDRSKIPEPSKPEPIEVGKMQTFKLDNGLSIFLVQAKDYPKFTISITAQQPGYDQEPQKEEKSVIENAYMEKKSKRFPNGEIDSVVNFKGGMLTAGIFTSNIKGMKRDFEQLLDMYADLLINPLITDEYIKKEAEEYQKRQEEKSKTTKKSGIKKIDMTSYFLDSLIYGKSKKQEKVVEKKEEVLDYSNLTIADIEKFRTERIVPNNTLAIVVGDFTVAECKKLMTKYLGDWKRGEDYISEDDDESGEPAIQRRNIIVVDKPEAVQSRISFHWALRDAFPFFEKDIELSVLNEVFGSSQMSYLYRNLREDKGLCYSIRSDVGAAGGGGTGSISTSVNNAKTELAIENIILEMIRIRNEKVNEHDLNIAKNSLIGEFSRQLSVIAPMYYISFGMQKMKYNLADDYLQNRIPRIYDVTANDIIELSRKYIDPFKCLIIVRGKADELKGKLEKFGDVSYVDKDGNLIKE